VTITITPSGQACGTQLTRLELIQPLDNQTVATIKSASLVHHVLFSPQQAMNDDELDGFGQYMGPFGNTPFISPIAGRSHVIAIRRSANETSELFAEGWHTDWNFQQNPPTGSMG
jgi:taurine dioxygenase